MQSYQDLFYFVLSVAMETSFTDWHTTDIVVRVRPTYENDQLVNQQGVIKSITVCIHLLVLRFLS